MDRTLTKKKKRKKEKKRRKVNECASWRTPREKTFLRFCTIEVDVDTRVDALSPMTFFECVSFIVTDTLMLVYSN